MYKNSLGWNTKKYIYIKKKVYKKIYKYTKVDPPQHTGDHARHQHRVHEHGVKQEHNQVAEGQAQHDAETHGSHWEGETIFGVRLYMELAW